MKRRDFLALSGAVSGGCLIPELLSRKIRDVCVHSRQPYLEAPIATKKILYAWGSGGEDFRLELGSRYDVPPYREFYAQTGTDVDNPEALSRRIRYDWDVGTEQELAASPWAVGEQAPPRKFVFQVPKRFSYDRLSIRHLPSLTISSEPYADQLWGAKIRSPPVQTG